MVDRRGFLALSAGAIALTTPGRVFAQSRNGFSGEPLTRWLSDGINMNLREDFSYRDPQGLLWRVRAPYTTDGASIPRFLWRVAGSPFVGLHRDAAIIHDAFCDTMSRSWQATHRVFYDAMRARGMGETEAKIKYLAVQEGGPRWNSTHRWTGRFGLFKRPRSQSKSFFVLRDPKVALSDRIVERRFEEYQSTEHEQASKLIAAENPSLDEIDNLTPLTDFDVNSEVANAQNIVDQMTSENPEGQLLVPPEFLNAPEAVTPEMIEEAAAMQSIPR
ncbi:DUF1353 domain-containing protein [uncultured Erythrobacter sp.]|uniref:DUF1353 domain-containing protein n=1 Tax=uncultured Erythrobacter sp. TaxID=263913 RepID=UPI002638E6D1|nr:DUF1353 domain-containing protein [uncultured Erythrobacter sp.]